MNNKKNKPSIWLILQTGIAVVGVVALSIGLYHFIQAATLPTRVLSIVGATGQPPLQMPEVAPQKDASSQIVPDELILPAMTSEVGKTLTFAAVLDPAADSLPRSITRRVQWRLFQKSGDGRYTAFAPSRPGLEFWSATTQIAAPGEYLLAVALPPVDLAALDNRDDPYVSRFLGGQAAHRCRMIRITITGKPAQEGKQPAAQPFADPPAGPVLFRIEQSSGQQPQPEPPQPPTPPQPETEDAAADQETEDEAKADQETEPAPEETQPTDMTMKRHGETNAVDSASQEQAQEQTQAAQPKSSVSVPPVTTTQTSQHKEEPAERTRPPLSWSEGNLPATHLSYNPDEIKALTPQQWDAICNDHQMPFVAVPTDSFYDEVGGWVIMLPGSAPRVMSPDEIERLYGLKFLSLDVFPAPIQAAAQERFGDAVLWFKCRAHRGFLLNRLLLKAIVDALEQEGIAIEDRHTVRSIRVGLSVETTEGRPRFIAKPEAIERKP